MDFLIARVNDLPPNGRRYRQGRDLADKATRRRIRRLRLNLESVGERPHLSGARGVSPLLAIVRTAFIFGFLSLFVFFEEELK